MTDSTDRTIAVVMMNLGGPTSLEDVEPYLYNIFSDPDVIQLPLGFLWQKRFARKISRARGAESRGIYGHIGGRSPILENTEAQALALEAALGPGYRTFIAMRAWKPSTEEAVDRLLAAGATEVVALPLYPQRSRTMTTSSMRELYRVLAERAPSLPVSEVCCFPEAPGLLDAWAAPVRAAYDGIAEERRERAHVLFSAHSLPQKLIDRGDPYLAHVQATVRGVMARLPAGLAHSLAFQSRATRARWLEPATEDALAALARDGIKDVIVVPIAFVTEHVETLYELDMLLKDPAIAAGIDGYHRVRVPATTAEMIGAFAERVRAARAAGPRRLCSEPGGVRCPGLK